MVRSWCAAVALVAAACRSAVQSAADMGAHFKNDFEHAVSVHWDAPGPAAGDDVHMFDMQRGERMGVNTFVGHKFYVTEVGSSEPLQYHVMASSIRQYTFGGSDPSSTKQCDATTGVCDGDEDSLDASTGAAVEPVVGPKVPKGANEKGEPVKVNTGECKDRHEVCKDYVANGECNHNPGWMTINCPVSCNACHLLDPKVRCDRMRLNISDVPVYAPGDMHNMFSSIQERFGERYGVTVLSEKPWVVTFDNFLSDDEVRCLWSTAGNGGLLELNFRCVFPPHNTTHTPHPGERADRHGGGHVGALYRHRHRQRVRGGTSAPCASAAEVAIRPSPSPSFSPFPVLHSLSLPLLHSPPLPCNIGQVGRVLSSGRTSSNAWCRHKCEAHPDVQRVQQKISEITGIPPGHSESFQVPLSVPLSPLYLRRPVVHPSLR